MKKKILIVVSLIMIVAMSLGFNARPVQAISSEWNTGADVIIDPSIHPVPETWLQLFGNGVKIDAPTTICHSFKQGGYGWIPVIYQLTDAGWVALETTNTRVNEESEYQACAVAPSAGTFALFAYYNEPAKEAISCQYDTSLWGLYWFNSAMAQDLYPGIYGYFLSAYVVYLPVGTRVNISLVSGFDGLTINSHGSGLVYDYDENEWADFMNAPFTATDGGTATFRITAAGCSAIYTIELPATD
jgi:hypothetical protein